MVSKLFELIELGITSDIEKLLINKNVDINERNEISATPAIVAASRNDFDTLKVLIAAGADLSLTDYNNWSALNWATFNQNDEMIDYIQKNTQQKDKAIKP